MNVDQVRATVHQYLVGNIDSLNSDEHGHLGVALQEDEAQYKQIVSEERERAVAEGRLVKNPFRR